MPAKITIKKGLKANLPTLATGQMALTTDTSKVYIGNNETNILINPLSEGEANQLLYANNKLGLVSLLATNVPYSQSFSSANSKITFNTSVPITNTSFIYDKTTGSITIPYSGVYKIQFTGNFKGTTFSYPLALRCAYNSAITDFYFVPKQGVSYFQTNMNLLIPIAAGTSFVPSIVGFQNTTDQLETYSMTEVLTVSRGLEVIYFSIEYFGPS